MCNKCERFIAYWFEVVSMQQLFKLDFSSLQTLTLVSKYICLTLKPFIEENYFFSLYSHKKIRRLVWYAPKKLRNVKEVDHLPLSATELVFYDKFQKRITSLPPNLTMITFGEEFNHPVDNLLPDTLTSLSFEFRFNQPVDHLPPNLKSLSFQVFFDKPVDHLPSKLTHLTFLISYFNQRIDKLPLSLTHFTLSNLTGVKYRHPLDQLQRNFESNLEYLTLRSDLARQYESSIPPNFIIFEYSSGGFDTIFKKQKSS